MNEGGIRGAHIGVTELWRDSCKLRVHALLLFQHSGMYHAYGFLFYVAAFPAKTVARQRYGN
jgi:hypothetical protein